MSYRITQQHNYTAVDVWNGSRWVASFASEADAKAFIASQGMKEIVGDLLNLCGEASLALKVVGWPLDTGLVWRLDTAIAKATKGAGE